MVSKCKVCKIISKPGGNLMFHRFPTNPKKLKQWLAILGYTGNPMSWRICSKHFKPEDYKQAVVSGKPRLRDSAEPSLHLKKLLLIDDSHVNTNASDQDIKTMSEHVNEDHDTSNELDIATEIEVVTPVVTNDPEQQHSTAYEQFLHDHDYTNNVSICRTALSSDRLNIHKSDEWAEFRDDDKFMNYKRIGDVEWDKVVNSPKKATICWDVAMEVIKEQQKEIKKLRSHMHSLKNRISNLQGLKKHLKLKNLPTFSQAKIVKKSSPGLINIWEKKMVNGKYNQLFANVNFGCRGSGYKKQGTDTPTIDY